MNSKDAALLQSIASANDPAQKAAIIAESIIADLDETNALIIRYCIVLHYITLSIVLNFVTKLLDDIDDIDRSKLSDEIYAQILSLPFTSTTEWGIVFHSLTRDGLIKHYEIVNPDYLILGAKMAAPVFEKNLQNIARYEAIYCNIVGQQYEKGSELFENLLLDKISRSDWESVSTIFQIVDEAERFSFAKPIDKKSYHWVTKGIAFLYQSNTKSAMDCFEHIHKDDEAYELTNLIRDEVYLGLQSLSDSLDWSQSETIFSKIIPQITKLIHSAVNSHDNIINISLSKDQKLLVRLKSGDQGAWTEFVKTYSIKVYNYLLANLPTAEDAEDVLSETMLALVRAVQSFDGKVSLATLTFAVAQRKLADFYSRQQNEIEINPNSSEQLHLTARGELMEALSSLTPQMRNALLLRYQVGLGIDEIAGVMGRSYKGVESLLHRARTNLLKVLERAITHSKVKGIETLIAKIGDVYLEKYQRLRLQNRLIAIEEMEDILDILNGDERKVIDSRFGLRDGIPMTRKSIGTSHNLSIYRVKQLEKSAMQKLKSPFVIARINALLKSDEKNSVTTNKQDYRLVS